MGASTAMPIAAAQKAMRMKITLLQLVCINEAAQVEGEVCVSGMSRERRRMCLSPADTKLQRAPLLRKPVELFHISTGEYCRPPADRCNTRRCREAAFQEKADEFFVTMSLQL